MNARNLKRNRFGAVDMEVEHPIYGWIPFTASPNDCEPLGRTLYAEAIAGAHGAIADVDPPSAEEVAAAAQRVTDNTARQTAKADSTISYLVTHTPAEINTYVRSNVNNLASATDMLVKLAVAVSVLARKELR